jgi:ribonuclease E
MPNSSHGGGISRKISSAADRKRLKQVVSDLTLPRTMGLIVRTAGLSRTKTEIKRDFDYLARLWDEIRERTLDSSAPALIHSDSDLIKRAIRDIYNRDIEEVVVEGEEGYKLAKQFMKLLMPSHARRVKQYSDPVPLFQRYGAEDQLKAMYDPVVQLKSGGYLVINPTEALVSIDINSGRSTKEHNIEQTALHTNLEAAREIARQLRLRDMAGLVVIDFIDQEHHSNTRKVEKAMKDALKTDRARIQVGRISSFGLMEMSRQRLRTGVLEATTRECPHCDGTGLVRTASSAGLSALRQIEDEAAKGKGSTIRLAASTEAAVYLLNEKRADLMEIEQRYHVTVEVVPEGEDEGAKMSVSSHGPKPKDAPRFDTIVDDEDDEEILDENDDDSERDDSNGGEDDDRPRKKRRRRRGGRGRNKGRQHSDDDDRDDSDDDDNGDDSDDDTDTDTDADSESDDGDDRPKKRRRRGGRRRGGRGRGRTSDEVTSEDAEKLEGVSDAVVEDMAVVAGPEDSPETAEAAAETEEKPKPRKRAPRKKKTDAEAEAAPAADAPVEGDAGAEAKPAPKKRAPRKKKAETEAVADAPAEGEAEAKPAPKKRAPRKKKVEAEAAPAAAPVEAVAEPATPPAPEPAAPKPVTEDSAASAEPAKPKRGWWQRTFGDE